MQLIFKDNPTADFQDRVCSVLLSLSMLADAEKRKISVNGELARIYRQEQQYHYQRAVLNTLRLLGAVIGHTELANDTNLDRICEEGHLGFQSMIEQYEAYFETEDIFEA